MSQTFINKIAPLAIKDMGRTGVLASLTIAQAILESNWGKSGLTVKGKALFGIKAGSSWKGKTINMQTGEVFDGKSVTIQANFRAYGSWEESIADHSKLFTTLARYQNLIGVTDYKRACMLVQKDGYATDPKYADKLINIIETYKLYEFDKEGETLPVELTPKQQKFIEQVVKLKLTDGKNPTTAANNLYVWEVSKAVLDYTMDVEAEVSKLKKQVAELVKQGVK